MSDDKSYKIRPPEYRLKALNKVTNKKGAVGAGWLNQDGSISIVLDSFVVLSGQDDLLITLFKQDPP